jgi:addiction module RelB/DinJ family antitoxin
MSIDSKAPKIYTCGVKTQVNLKIDKDVKKNAQKMAEELGLSLSSVVNATLKQFARTGELELSLAPKITSQLEEIVLEARKDYSEGKTSGPFDNAEDLIKHLGI